jgi:hypothetical protein
MITDLALVITDLARYAVTGYANGVVELTCTRCGAPGVFGLDDEDVALSDLAVWARDHRCLAVRRPLLRRGAPPPVQVPAVAEREREFVVHFSERLAAVADLAAILPMQRELGKAILERVITTETLADLQVECTARRRQLELTCETGPATPSQVNAGEVTGPQPDSRAARAEEYMQRLVDEAPPLTDEQVARLRAIISSSRNRTASRPVIDRVF